MPCHRARRFCKFFATKGCWLVDLADRPVNNLAAAERRQVVAGGTPRLAELIAEARPKRIVVIKSDIAAAVDEAIALAGIRKPTVLALRYPLRQWRAEYIGRLAEFLRT